MASSAGGGGGWFSMRRDDRGSEELSWKSENATQRVSSSVSESFPKLVTCKNVLQRSHDTNLAWRIVPRTIRKTGECSADYLKTLYTS
jgi:hypothetical protein